MNRIARIATSFASVLAAYWAYALLAVPWIEPPARARWNGAPQVGGINPIDQLSSLRELFLPGDWELQPNTKILASDEGKVLYQDYKNITGTAKTSLTPCTIIYTPHGSSTVEAEQLHEAMILRAPEGAELEFSEPFKLGRPDIPQLVAGRLLGRITIRGGGKSPGTEDDLRVDVARDIEYSEKESTISTSSPIDFALGKSTGRGSDMRIELLSGDTLQSGNHHGLNAEGIKKIEIRHLERLHLEPAGMKIAQGKAGSSKSPAVSAGDLPIEICCRGPFSFDAVEQTARFDDQVELLRIHPDGPSDQIVCDSLAIEFTHKRPAAGGPPAATAKSRGGLSDLQPKRVEARGNPVVIRAPAQKLEGRGERLEYDLIKNEVILGGAQGAFLKQDANEIHAPTLRYQFSASGRLGQATALGPGWLRGQMDSRPGPPLEARWKDKLLLWPDEHGQQVISLLGDAELKYGAIGQLSAGEVHLWLIDAPASPVPAASASPRIAYQPERMKAIQNVRVEGSQFSCAVGQLEVWFEPPSPSARGSPAAGLSQNSPLAEDQAAQAGVFRSAWRPDKGEWPANAMTVAESRPPAAPPGSGSLPFHGMPSASGPHGRFHVDANLLRINVVGTGAQAEVSKVIVEDNVRITEEGTAQPGEKPVVVAGDRIEAFDPGKPHVAVRITGNRAHFEGRGITLDGPNINLNAGINRLWIEGPGEARLPMDRSLTGQAVRSQGPLTIKWRNRMDTIDDRTLIFDNEVVVDTGPEQLGADTLKVRFCGPLRFAETKGQPRPEIETVACSGAVRLEGREADATGLTSVEHIRVNDLVMNKVTGAIRAVGPGRVVTVRRQTGELPAMGLGPGTPSRPQTPANGSQLICLDVRFQGELTGDLRIPQLVFHELVRVLYSPVSAWDARLDEDDPNVPGPEGMALSCDQLTVTQLPVPGSKAHAWGLEASGNTRAERPQSFFAAGDRMTYDQTKDQLVLKGDGRADALLVVEDPLKPRRTLQSRQILFCPSTKQFKLDGFRDLVIPDLPASQKASRPAMPGQR